LESGFAFKMAVQISAIAGPIFAGLLKHPNVTNPFFSNGGGPISGASGICSKQTLLEGKRNGSSTKGEGSSNGAITWSAMT
jgi:hypothetical protein